MPPIPHTTMLCNDNQQISGSISQIRWPSPSVTCLLSWTAVHGTIESNIQFKHQDSVTKEYDKDHECRLY